MMVAAAILFLCAVGGVVFVFSSGEQEFHASKGFDKPYPGDHRVLSPGEVRAHVERQEAIAKPPADLLGRL